jgi:(2Fe-2S) ferredoxin
MSATVRAQRSPRVSRPIDRRAIALQLCTRVRHCSRVPHRERYLFVCTNRRPDGDPRGSCAEKGAEAVVLKLKAALKSRGVVQALRACSSSCLDLCETGISIVQEPDHVAYGNVTIDDVDAIADAAVRGDVVERLIVHRSSNAPRAERENGGQGEKSEKGERP